MEERFTIFAILSTHLFFLTDSFPTLFVLSLLSKSFNCAPMHMPYKWLPQCVFYCSLDEWFIDELIFSWNCSTKSVLDLH